MATDWDRILQILAVTLLYFSGIYSYDVARGLQVLPHSQSTNNTCPLGKSGPVCVGCGILLTCLPGNPEPLNRTPCYNLDPTFNSCKDGQCFADMKIDPACGLPSKYTCTGGGYFPDIHDCKRYYVCTDEGAIPFVKDCPYKQIYDSRTGRCCHGSCKPIDCSKYPHQHILYKLDPSILIYCTKDGDAFLFRCPDPENMQYSAKTLQCIFNCKREGRFKDVSNCHKYYECYKSGGSYKSRLECCENGLAFSATLQRCVKDPKCV